MDSKSKFTPKNTKTDSKKLKSKFVTKYKKSVLTEKNINNRRKDKQIIELAEI